MCSPRRERLDRPQHGPTGRRRQARCGGATVNPRAKAILGSSKLNFATNPDDGARIAYELVGEGTPLLLFHGSLTSGALWRALGYVDALYDEHRMILIDARGHGHSEKPTTMDSYAMDRLVGDVIAVLDDCELAQTAYLGYSMGGRVGFGMAIRAPERVRALIVGGASHRPQNGALDRIFYPGFVDTIETEGIESFLEQCSGRLGRAIDPAVRQVFLGSGPRARAAVLPDAELFVIADSDHESTLGQVDDVVQRVRAFVNRSK